MSSVLRDWFREARAEGQSPDRAVRSVAQRIDEPEETVRRLLIAAGERKLAPAPAPKRDGPHNGHAEVPAEKVQDLYRSRREAGVRHEDAVKQVARSTGRRPHDLRSVVAPVEYELRHVQ